VYCTADNVCLVFGVLPKSHGDALESLLKKQTNNTWINDPGIASIIGAKRAIGLPEHLNGFKLRLENELSKQTIL
jgi:TRAP-type C4-dicarboxylate transport system substrate-binding protein